MRLSPILQSSGVLQKLGQLLPEVHPGYRRVAEHHHSESSSGHRRVPWFSLLSIKKQSRTDRVHAHPFNKGEAFSELMK